MGMVRDGRRFTIAFSASLSLAASNRFRPWSRHVPRQAALDLMMMSEEHREDEAEEDAGTTE